MYIVDGTSHRFFQCQKTKGAVLWLKRVIEHISNMKFQSIESLLYFNFPKIHKKVLNSMCKIISDFISVIWLCRENLDFVTEKIIAKVYNDKRFLNGLLKEKFNDVFCKKYSEIEFDMLMSMIS